MHVRIYCDKKGRVIVSPAADTHIVAKDQAAAHAIKLLLKAHGTKADIPITLLGR